MTTTEKHKSEEDIEFEKILMFHFKTIAAVVIIIIITELILSYLNIQVY